MNRPLILLLSIFITSNTTPLHRPAQIRAKIIEDSVGALLGASALQFFAQNCIADFIGTDSVTTDEIAEQLGLQMPNKALEQILRIVAYKGYMIHQCIDDVSWWKLSEVGDYLQRDFPNTMGAYAAIPNEAWWQSIQQVEHTVETGEPVFQELYGENFFELEGPDFAEGMAVYSAMEEPWLAQHLNLRSFDTIVDLGGGYGGLSREIAQEYPSANVTLFDMQETIEGAQKLDPQNTIGYQVGDFTKAIEPADVFIFKRVLLDWPGKKVIDILTRAREALNDGGRIFIIDGLVGSPQHGQVVAQFSLLMNLFFGAHHRTAKEMTECVKQAGLEVDHIRTTPFEINIIEVKKK